MDDYNLLAEHIAAEYIRTITGAGIPDRFVGDEAIEDVMAGMLAENRVEKTFSGGYRESENDRFKSVPSMSIRFVIDRESTGDICIIPQGLLFYTVCPEYEEICRYFIALFSESDRTEYTDIMDIVASHGSETVPVPPVYRRISLEDVMAGGILIPVKSLRPGSFSLEEDITEKLDRIAEGITEEIRIMPEISLPVSVLQSKHEFEKLCRPKEERVLACWGIDIRVTVAEEESGLSVYMTMVNRTPAADRRNLGYRLQIFNAGMRVIGDKSVKFRKIPLDYFRSTFKEKQAVYAVPENTAARYIPETNEIRTDNVPVYRQFRTRTKDELSEYARFDRLAEDPVGNLQILLRKMEEDLKDRRSEFERERKKLSAGAEKEFDVALRNYEQEISRFRDGIGQIRYKQQVRQAFILMNRTFAHKLRDSAKTYDGWRLFQIVFVVSLICEVIRSEYPDDHTSGMEAADLEAANLLYFPTGGGKTEAFLGITVFALFFDRLRGKDEGVTAILKYPLRLLAVQQLDRVLTVLMKANAVRAQEPILMGTNEFALGFYVGSFNTPNRITAKERLSSRGYSSGNTNRVIVESDPETLTEWYRFIDTCPVCGQRSVSVRFNQKNWKLEHICENPACTVQVLPIMIVDEEIYRYLPSVIVSTIDKMAAVGLNVKFRSLFGQVKTECPIHGFSVSGRCECGTECAQPMIPVGRLKDPAPTLFIQDEMHLVKESLGTFDAHYESFLHYYAENLLPEEQRKKIRFIGATATISMYQDHIRNLYHMEGRRFPCEYPSVRSGEDFYSRTDYGDITRIIIGYAPYGRSITNGVWQSAYIMRLLVFGLMKNADETYQVLREKGFQGSREALRDMLRDYWIELIYNTSKDDVMNLGNSFENQANDRLEAKKVPLYKVESMTSDIDFQQVRKTLFAIDANRGKLEETNLILATSTISHGVDEDSFNVMFFYGMPSNNAEYIQASSRIGRKYTGVAVDIIRLARLRDRSYLKNFVIFHENRDDLVETVPINRWARNAVYSTLPGLLAALLYQYYTPRLKVGQPYETLSWQRLLNAGDLDIAECMEQLIRIYGCSTGEKLSMAYSETIRSETRRILEGIQNGVFTKEDMLANSIGRFARDGRRPMSSLRDTEPQLEIRID